LGQSNGNVDSYAMCWRRLQCVGKDLVLLCLDDLEVCFIRWECLVDQGDVPSMKRQPCLEESDWIFGTPLMSSAFDWIQTALRV
jgi:hypothetical protein